jgi:hypothetical protein
LACRFECRSFLEKSKKEDSSFSEEKEARRLLFLVLGGHRGWRRV